MMFLPGERYIILEPRNVKNASIRFFSIIQQKYVLVDIVVFMDIS